MRFARFNLVKFGMFTDTELDLLAEGVNVIVGANEAGKTTTMAAMHQLLYGIPLRSSHSYIHSNSDLRIGAVLRDNDGDEFELYRIKRNIGSLRAADDAVVGEEVLATILGGVGADVYASLFSIGHEEIVSGGQALLKSEGELGRALFAAGTGLTQLNSIMAKLEFRAGELFKSGASKPLINEGISRYKDSISAMKAHSQSSSAVESLDRTLRDAEQKLGEIEADHRELSIALTRATRVRQSRGRMEKRRSSLQEIAELDAAGPRVAASIPELLAEAQSTRRESASSLTTLLPDLEEINERLAGIVVDELLCAQAKEIERLVEELGGIRQNFKDLPGLNKQVGDLERHLEELLRRIPNNCRRDETGMPAITDVERSRIERLSDAWIRIDNGLSASRSSLDDAQRFHDGNASSLEALPVENDVGSLRAAVARIRGQGQLESNVEALRQQVVGLLSKVDAMINAMGVTVDAREADKLALPSPASVSEVDRLVEATKAAVTAAVAEDERVKDELVDLEGQLSGLLQHDNPPSVDDLDHARRYRDEGWGFVRAAWLENASRDEQIEIWSGGQSLDRAYEAALGKTDEIADRLRREAEAVERSANLRAQIAVKIGTIEERASLMERLQDEHESAREQWRKLWEPITVEVGSREVMDEFIAKAHDIAASAGTLRDLDGRTAELCAAIQRCATDLRGLLREMADEPDDELSLVALLERAEHICTASDAAREKRLLAVQALESSRASMDMQRVAVETAEKALSSWELEWADAVEPLGLLPSTLSLDVASMLPTLEEIENTSTELDEKQRRVAGIERRNSDVDHLVATVLATLPHLEINPTASEVAINVLQNLLKIAQTDASTRRTLQEQCDSKTITVEGARASVARANAEIAELIAECRVADEEALVEAIDRTNRARALEADVEQIQSDLIDAAGISLEQLAEEVDALTDTDLDLVIGDLSSRRETLDLERKEKALDIGGLRSEKALIDDSDEAALDAELAQLVLSAVAAHTEEYVRVMLARYLLDQQITEYRTHNQGPILKRASEIFRQLTLEEYSGIDTDNDDKGLPVILATRGSGGSLDVIALSTGARDQLYLALRLAALEHYATGTRTLPLLLDDLFVHFDDERTRAGLVVLEGMSSKMQVLLFTHHERVADQAAEAITNDKLRVQLLTH